MGKLAWNTRPFHPVRHCLKSLFLSIVLRTKGVTATTADMPLILAHGAGAVYVLLVNRKTRLLIGG